MSILIDEKEQNWLVSIIYLACIMANDLIENTFILQDFAVNVRGKNRDALCHALLYKTSNNSQVKFNNKNNYKYTEARLSSGETISISHVPNVNNRPEPTTYRQGYLFSELYNLGNQIDYTLVYCTDPITNLPTAVWIEDCRNEENKVILQIPSTIEKEIINLSNNFGIQRHIMVDLLKDELIYTKLSNREQDTKPNYKLTSKEKSIPKVSGGKS